MSILKLKKMRREKKYIVAQQFLPPGIDVISLLFLSISGQSDSSPLHHQSLQLFPHHPSQVTLARIPLSTKPTTQQPSHHTIVQPNSSWDGYKMIGGRLRGNVCLFVLRWNCVSVCGNKWLCYTSERKLPFRK